VFSKLSGILAAIVTPFTEDNRIDRDALALHTDRLIAAQVGGIVTCGSTGEFPSLSVIERREVSETVFEAARSRVPIVVQTGSTRVYESVELSRHAADLGAEAVMVVAPYYEPLSWPETINYYRLLANLVKVPIMLYHIPGATGRKLTADQVFELARIDAIQFMKDSSNDESLLVTLLHAFRERSDFAIFNGWDSLNFVALASGARGSVWGMANFIPELCVEFYRSCQDFDEERMRNLWIRILPLVTFCESHTYVAAVKAGCELVGYRLGGPRLPILPLMSDEVKQLVELLKSAGVATAEQAPLQAPRQSASPNT
jgi:4-hydroxy-tetrahydrodipicolinate synthase